MDPQRKIAEVELSRRTLDEAINDGLGELGLTSRDQAEIEVVSEGKPGFLGIGREMAVVVMRPKPPEKKQRRRRRRSKSGSGDSDGAKGGGRATGDSGRSEDRQAGGTSKRGGGGQQQRTGSQGGRSGARDEGSRPNGASQKRDKGNGRSQQRKGPAEEPSMTTDKGSEAASGAEPPQESSIEDQATIAVDFVKGLLEAFGLEGTVTPTIDVEENLLKIDVTGDQTEALVGRKGAIMHSVLELSRTVVQRKTYGAPRMRIDINGYGERRREALRIYAARLAEQVIADGGEVMLEPMNSADRKVVHDAIAEIDGVDSFSEGEDPERAVVISASS